VSVTLFVLASFFLKDFSNADGRVYLPGPGVMEVDRNGSFLSPTPCEIASTITICKIPKIVKVM
jgi:hypothetical protein